MKKIFILVFILFIGFSLSGCTNFFCDMNPNQKMCEITYEPITGNTEGLVTNGEVYEVVDMAEDFDFTIESLNLFEYSDNPGIPYVDAQEFLYVMHEGLNYYRVSIGTAFNLTYSVNYSGSIFGSYSYDLQLSDSEQTLYYSDFGFGGDFNVSPQIDFNSDVRLTGGEYIEGTRLNKIIYLADYDIKIIEEEGVYFIPLYLANLILTGDYLNVYMSGDKIYIVDDFYSVQEILDNEGSTLMQDEDNLIYNTVNFAAMFFDNFYGLKDFFEVDSYLADFTERGWYEAESIEILDVLMQEFIFDLDDLHTQIAHYGAKNDGVGIVHPEQDSRLVKFYTVYMDDICYERDYDYDFQEYDYFYILEINEFNLQIYDYLNEVLVDLNPEKPVFIDLGCNSGGSLGAVLELAAYLTNDDIPLKYINPYTGEGYSLLYQGNTDKAMTNELYLFTSNMTYSAANLFTSMVKDNGWATIIGNDSLGGACSVLYSVFPNNLVLTYSSMMTMLNNEGEIIEMGIAPDYYDDYSLSAYEVATNIFEFFDRYVELYVVDDFSEGIYVAIGTDWPEGENFDHFEVILTNTVTNEEIRQNYTTPTLEFTADITNDLDNYEITIICYYQYEGFSLQYLVYYNDMLQASI